MRCWLRGRVCELAWLVLSVTYFFCFVGLGRCFVCFVCFVGLCYLLMFVCADVWCETTFHLGAMMRIGLD